MRQAQDAARLARDPNFFQVLGRNGQVHNIHSDAYWGIRQRAPVARIDPFAVVNARALVAALQRRRPIPHEALRLARQELERLERGTFTFFPPGGPGVPPQPPPAP
jgi:hypothetical protein